MIRGVAASDLCSVCGQPLDATEICAACLLRVGLQDEAPLAYGDFEIERRDDGSAWELGRGASGITYRAMDTVLHRAVALKVIEASNAQVMRERLLREARAAAALRHPNIAAVFQFGVARAAERCYCAMELVEGETLEARVHTAGPLSADVVLEIAIQVARALIAAAERGLVHRDLKPGNIMLATSENHLHVKVIDFGLAKAMNVAAEMELTQAGFVGTPAFASPEQFAHQGIDARTDIYALGATIWFALTGRVPFAGANIEEIRNAQTNGILPLEQLKSRAVPPPVIELVRSCLAINPAERPASPLELMTALETCRGRVLKKRRGVTWAVCAILVVATAIFFVPLNSARKSEALANSGAPRKPTENAEAYLLFLRARENDLSSETHRSQSLPLYEQAITLDPKFALAHARFSIAATSEGLEKQDAAWYRKARMEADLALRLQPNLGDGHLALASWYIYSEHDPDRALVELNRAATLLPNSAEVHLMAAWAFKQQNKLRDRLVALRRAEAIDPRYHDVRIFLMLTLRWVREWQQAIDALDRGLVVVKESEHLFFFSPWARANDEFRLTGNIDVLKQAVAKEEGAGIEPDRLKWESFQIAMFTRDFATATRLFPEIQTKTFHEFGGFVDHGKPFLEALLADARGADVSQRQEILDRAEKSLEATLQASHGSDQARTLADLAIIHALAGRHDDAIREAQRAIDVMPGTPGSIEKNALAGALALVYARTGEPNKAIDLIEHLLTIPCEVGEGAVYNMTLTDLKWRWIWDPLRSHPRFQRLIAGPEPKTIY